MRGHLQLADSFVPRRSLQSRPCLWYCVGLIAAGLPAARLGAASARELSSLRIERLTDLLCTFHEAFYSERQAAAQRRVRSTNVVIKGKWFSVPYLGIGSVSAKLVKYAKRPDELYYEYVATLRLP